MTLSRQIRALAEGMKPIELTDAEWINIRNKAASILLSNATQIADALERDEARKDDGK